MAACETQPPKYIHFRSSNGYIQLNLGFSSSQGDRKTVRDIKSSTCWKITEKKKTNLCRESCCFWLFY